MLTYSGDTKKPTYDNLFRDLINGQFYDIDYDNPQNTTYKEYTHPFPANYFVLIVNMIPIMKDQVIQKIEGLGNYKYIAKHFGNNLYFINTLIDKEHKIYTTSYFNVRIPIFINSPEETTFETIDYPCIIDSRNGNISNHDILNATYSFEPLTDQNTEYKIFLMDRRKYLTKGAIKKTSNNNNN